MVRSKYPQVQILKICEKWKLIFTDVVLPVRLNLSCFVKKKRLKFATSKYAKLVDSV